ncbi:MAG: S1 RNA-binding domain-containing protein [Chloroflexi bacterium]|nr:S1 RNA-binding domain-containing protein [Chloroflexota bacterium]
MVESRDSGGSGLASEAPAAGMASLLQDLDRYSHAPKRGEILQGVVVGVDREGYLVDVGLKSEGIVPQREVEGWAQAGGAPLRVGDEVHTTVIWTGDREGRPVLSLARARVEHGWQVVQESFEQNVPLEGRVIDHNRGGLIVDIEGLRGFLPLSQIASKHWLGAGEDRQGAEVLLGERIQVRVLEVNRRRNRLILSERVALQEERERQRERLLAELAEGQIRQGKVTSLCDFGAFVDLGGADGLIHISELAWDSVHHPSEVVKEGDEVSVYVLSVDSERKRVALSLKRAQPGPWDQVAHRYNVGDTVRVTITKLATFGAFARLEAGVEGLIHISELSDVPIAHPRHVVGEGNQVDARVIRIDLERHRIGLSLRGVYQETVPSPEGLTLG